MTGFPFVFRRARRGQKDFVFLRVLRTFRSLKVFAFAFRRVRRG
jgi:hypothetical protein